MFEIKKFNSGEYDIKLVDRIDKFEVKWNWFKEKDIMIPILKSSIIRQNYGHRPIDLICNYLPYSRQDRIFEVGQTIPLEDILSIFYGYFDEIKIMTPHYLRHFNRKLDLVYVNTQIPDIDYLYSHYNIVFPDKSASKHVQYYYEQEKNGSIVFNKVRTNEGVQLELASSNINNKKKYLICDDICDGGRTFVQCAIKLKELYGDNIHIELLITHAFLTHGLDDLKASGIKKIHIANPDSYEYVCELYPQDVDYFELYSKF
jgi:ribose-phosphate pyrophosphokinase